MLSSPAVPAYTEPLLKAAPTSLVSQEVVRRPLNVAPMFFLFFLGGGGEGRDGFWGSRSRRLFV